MSTRCVSTARPWPPLEEVRAGRGAGGPRLRAAGPAPPSPPTQRPPLPVTHAIRNHKIDETGHQGGRIAQFVAGPEGGGPRSEGSGPRGRGGGPRCGGGCAVRGDGPGAGRRTRCGETDPVRGDGPGAGRRTRWGRTV